MFPNIEPSNVGVTGLLWLLFSYGYILFRASNLISEGSDLLLLVPSLAGLVGGVVLPLLGAVPDGAIMLFSGLGDLEEAQETLSVGVGALAGSTIMLLTVPWALSVYGGRVDLVGPDSTPNYTRKPKLNEGNSFSEQLSYTGVAITEEVRHGAIIMMVTTIPYFLIQGPALFLHGKNEDVAKGEKFWALAGLVVCLTGFFAYLYLQLSISQKGLDKNKRVAAMKKKMQEGSVSLSGALADLVKYEEQQGTATSTAPSIAEAATLVPPDTVKEYLNDLLRDEFHHYDKNANNVLEKKEFKNFLRDFHESLNDSDVDVLMGHYDHNGDGTISYDEFVSACYSLIKSQIGKPSPVKTVERLHSEIAANVFEDDAEEEEEVPEDLADMTPEEQQTAIKTRAFSMLAAGTFLVVLFSDPMVDVMNEIAYRFNLSPFYVSFVLAPLASNASEVIASLYYARKKTRKTIAVSLTALEGAASMNNTFCLSIFMGLVFFRGLAWHYTAETLAILLVQFVIGALAQNDVMKTSTGLLIFAIFPFSIALVAGLEFMGLD